MSRKQGEGMGSEKRTGKWMWTRRKVERVMEQTGKGVEGVSGEGGGW